MRTRPSGSTTVRSVSGIVRTVWVSSTARPLTVPSVCASNTVTMGEGRRERAAFSTAATCSGVR
jgi:hypothetical protein